MKSGCSNRRMAWASQSRPHVGVGADSDLRPCRRRVSGPGGWLAVVILVSGADALAHGFHGAALMESSASVWENKVRENLGLPSAYVTGEGDLRDLLKRAAPGAGGRTYTVPPVEREKVKATVQELVSYLKYMDSRNILAEEFPNFPMAQIPDFRTRAMYILRDLGPSSLPDVVAGLADVTAPRQSGRPEGPRFADPYFDPTLVIAGGARRDLEKTLNLIISASAGSPEGLEAALDALGAMVNSDDASVKGAAREAMKAVKSQATVYALLGLAGKAASDASRTAIALLQGKLAEPGCRLSVADAVRAMEAVESNPTPALREMAPKIVEGGFADKDAPALVEALRTADKILTPALARLLARRLKAGDVVLSDDQASVLLGLLRGANEEAASALAAALDAGLRDSHLALMKKTAADEHERLRVFATAWILRRRPAEIEQDALRRALENPDSMLGSAVYQGLSSRELLAAESDLLRSHPELLLKTLRSPTAASRRAAAKLAGRLRMKEAVPDLIRLITDPDSGVFEAAVMALPEITRQFFGPELFADERAKKDAQKKWTTWWESSSKGRP